MRNFIIFTLVSLFAANIYAKDYTLNFAPNDPADLIDSIQSINLITNDTVSILGRESLILSNSISGIHSIEYTGKSIFPNPCNGTTTFQFSTTNRQSIIVDVLNSSGQLILSKSKDFMAGLHSLSIQFPEKGIYIITTQIEGKLLTQKIISTKSYNNASISYIGTVYLPNETSFTEKSAATGKSLFYSEGDNILFNIYSGTNITVIVDQPSESKTYNVQFHECTDNNNNNYKTVEIGNQVWMAENLRTTKYPDGSNIPLKTNNIGWKELNSNNTDDALIFYGNNKNSIYGALYSYAAAIGDNWTHDLTDEQGVCPVGWHIPSDTEWKNLEISLGMSQCDVDSAGSRGTEEGSMIKSSNGWNKNGNGSNISGFSALPGGYQHAALGYNYEIGEECDFWSSTEYDNRDSWYRHVGHDYKGIRRYNARKSTGFSVRCVKN